LVKEAALDAYREDPHTSMLFGKFDFSTFGASAYGSLATPAQEGIDIAIDKPFLPPCKPDHAVYGATGSRPYCMTSWKPRGYCGFHSWVQSVCTSTCSDPAYKGAPGPMTGKCAPDYGMMKMEPHAMLRGRRMEAAPVAEREYGVSSDFASITLDFGDFSYMSTTVRRLAEEKAVDAPVPASVGAKGFDPLRTTALELLEKYMKFTEEHEWLRVEGDLVVVGITEHASSQLGDIVFVELPDEGTTVSKDDEIVVIESVKAASDILSPLDGEIVEINETLVDEPSKVNDDPMGDAWFFKVKPSNINQIEEYMDEAAYTKLIG
jgi:glycine cleavage system H protein